MDDLLSSATTVATLPSGQTVLAITITPGTGHQVWQQLRDAHGQTGLWPFLLEESSDREFVWEHAIRGEDGGGRHTAGQVLATPSGRDDDELVVHLPERPGPGWPPSRGTDGIGLIQTSAGGYDIPRLLSWNGAGASNGLSSGEVTKVLMSWRDRFGVELVALGHDSLSLLVPHPPTTPAEVAEVAAQQAEFCAEVDMDDTQDALFQQVHSHYWNFWWD
jgi:hypothetical protein